MTELESQLKGPGLTGVEVAERISRGQVNRASTAAWADYRAILARNVVTLFNAMVVPAAVALFLVDDYRGAWAVSGMAVVNTLLGLIQEIRSKRQLDRLSLLASPQANVYREGRAQTINAADVVLDDTVLLAPGRMIVADGVLLAARYLEVDEALLTGESDPVSRHPGERVLSGSVCVAGDGAYRVDRVGNDSFAQKTAAQARLYFYAPSPMQRTLDTLIRILTGLAVGLCLLYGVIFYFRRFPSADLWQMIAATVTSMVPQGLVLMTTVAFTLGAVRMSRRGALVQRLNAVESMASIDVLCMDKTGTLTTSGLILNRVLPMEKDDAEARQLLRVFGRASIDEESKTIQAIRRELGTESPVVDRLDQVPFKSQNRYSAVKVRFQGNDRALMLGAWEAVEPFLEASTRSKAEAIWREILPTGLRLLVFAENALPGTLAEALRPGSMRPLAVIALSDELRPNAGRVLEELARQGIRIKILSGDHPETVHAALGKLNLPLAKEPVVTGAELESSDQRSTLIRDRGVFGRLAPAQKLEIIEDLQRQKFQVAMLGDGINDILAIKRSDLGIAMGAGSGATKTVAALMLENNDFSLLPETLDEGRIIFWNLRRAAKLFLLKNVYTLVLIVFALGILGLGFPYLPQQVTLLNALTIGGPSFLVMLSRKPQADNARTQRGFLREVGGFALTSGLVTGGAGLLVWLIAAWGFGEDLPTQRTTLLSTLILMGLGNLLLVVGTSRWFLVWILLALAAYGTILAVPPLAFFFALTPLSPGLWMLVGGAGAVGIVLSGAASRYEWPLR